MANLVNDKVEELHDVVDSELNLIDRRIDEIISAHAAAKRDQDQLISRQDDMIAELTNRVKKLEQDAEHTAKRIDQLFDQDARKRKNTESQHTDGAQGS